MIPEALRWRLAKEVDQGGLDRRSAFRHGTSRGSTFAVGPGRAGLVIGAPHGSSDGATDAMAHALANASGWGAVVVTGFGGAVAGERRLNVNRPTESVPGTPAALEDETPPAREAYQSYLAHVGACVDGPVIFYVEVHGNSRRESAGRIEVATVGVEIREARWLKRLLEGVRDEHLRSREEIPRLAIVVEGPDAIHYRASAAKRRGLLGTVRRALHVELPRAARREHPGAYGARRLFRPRRALVRRIEAP